MACSSFSYYFVKNVAHCYDCASSECWTLGTVKARQRRGQLRIWLRDKAPQLRAMGTEGALTAIVQAEAELTAINDFLGGVK